MTVKEEDLWDPLHAFVNRLKKTEYKDTGQSLHDRTNIVIILNVDGSLHGNVKGLIDMDMATKNRIGKLEDKIFLPIGK